ncbi:MAG: PilN domain-containing protein [Methylococcaceae bacterium]|nr:PilN domain-containing protein [Methylococcaceae bacterium]
MMQQVNLYKDILKAEQKQHNLLLYAIVLMALSLCVIGFSVYREWDLLNLEKLAVQSRKELGKVKTQVEQLVALQPPSEISASLTAEVADWQSSLDELMQTMHLMDDKRSGHSTGFSAYFQAFSRQSSAEVWLTNISIRGLQQTIDLEGSTFTPQAVPVFLQKLQQEPIFAGKTFAKLVMIPSEKVPGQLDFKLSALLDTAEDKAHVK